MKEVFLKPTILQITPNHIYKKANIYVATLNPPLKNAVNYIPAKRNNSQHSACQHTSHSNQFPTN
jgi:hypothetical protein